MSSRNAAELDEQGGSSSSSKRDAVRKECEDSLRRLQLDVIDLYQIHWPEPGEDLEEGWRPWLAQAGGKVRWIGVSNCSADR